MVKKGKGDATKSVRGKLISAATGYREPVGHRIYELRKKQGLSQAELAREAGQHQSFISRVENGELKKNLNVFVLHSIAAALNMDLEPLIEGTTHAAVLNESPPPRDKQFAYCPNVECPKAVYRLTGYSRSYSVKELWQRHKEALRCEKNPVYAPYWECMAPEDPDFEKYSDYDVFGNRIRPKRDTPKKLRTEDEHCVIVYRWVPLDENTIFCEECGTKLRNDCPFCEVPLKHRDQKFCHHCGRQLNKPPEQEKRGKKK